METQRILDFQFVPTVKGHKNAGRALPENVCSVTYAPNYKAVRFPKNLTKIIMEAGCKSMRLAYNSITASYAFVFLPGDEGHHLTINHDKVKEVRISVASVDIVKILAKVYGKKKGDSFRLNLSENISRREDVVFLLIEGIYEE